MHKELNEESVEQLLDRAEELLAEATEIVNDSTFSSRTNEREGYRPDRHRVMISSIHKSEGTVDEIYGGLSSFRGRAVCDSGSSRSGTATR